MEQEQAAEELEESMTDRTRRHVMCRIESDDDLWWTFNGFITGVFSVERTNEGFEIFIPHAEDTRWPVESKKQCPPSVKADVWYTRLASTLGFQAFEAKLIEPKLHEPCQFGGMLVMPLNDTGLSGSQSVIAGGLFYGRKAFPWQSEAGKHVSFNEGWELTNENSGCIINMPTKTNDYEFTFVFNGML